MAKSPTGRAPPEARLPFACLGAILLPIGIFWFAWTSTPSVHWISPVLAGVPFGCGMLLVFTSVIGEFGTKTKRDGTRRVAEFFRRRLSFPFLPRLPHRHLPHVRSFSSSSECCYAIYPRSRYVHSIPHHSSKRTNERTKSPDTRFPFHFRSSSVQSSLSSQPTCTGTSGTLGLRLLVSFLFLPSSTNTSLSSPRSLSFCFDSDDSGSVSGFDFFGGSLLVGFLSLVCVPMPFIFMIYGEK